MNNAKKFFEIFLTLLISLITINASALECSITYNSSTNELTLSGTASAPVTLMILPSDETPDLISNQHPPVSGAQFDFHKQQTFNEVLRLDPYLKSGLYTVKVQSQEKEISAIELNERLYDEKITKSIVITDTINHISKTDASSLLSEINTVKNDESKLYSLISSGTTNGSQNSYLLGIDLDSFAQSGDYVCSQIAGTKNKSSFANIDEIISLIKQYNILYSVTKAKSTDDAVEILENNSSPFPVDIKRFVSSLDNASRSYLLAQIKSFKANGTSFSDELPKLSALAAIQGADRWKSIKNIVTDTYDDILKINYKNVKNIDRVFAQMMEYEYHTYSDILNNFLKADSIINPTSENPVKPSQSSGGGGGGKYFVDTPKENSSTDYLSEQKNDLEFSDVPHTFWGWASIDSLVKQNIITGYPDKTFKPENIVTRAEFVKMLVSAFKISKADTINFSDVTKNDWFYEYISAAYSNGIIKGASQNYFYPNDAISREDACVIIHRYLSGINKLTDTKSEFNDSESFSDYAKDSIAILAGNGIINGVGNNYFEPKSSIDRGSCAVLIYNCLKIVQ